MKFGPKLKCTHNGVPDWSPLIGGIGLLLLLLWRWHSQLWCLKEYYHSHNWEKTVLCSLLCTSILNITTNLQKMIKSGYLFTAVYCSTVVQTYSKYFSVCTMLQFSPTVPQKNHCQASSHWCLKLNLDPLPSSGITLQYTIFDSWFVQCCDWE